MLVDASVTCGALVASVKLKISGLVALPAASVAVKVSVCFQVNSAMCLCRRLARAGAELAEAAQALQTALHPKARGYVAGRRRSPLRCGRPELRLGGHSLREGAVSAAGKPGDRRTGPNNLLAERRIAHVRRLRIEIEDVRQDQPGRNQRIGNDTACCWGPAV
jgi:hypothetical protein